MPKPTSVPTSFLAPLLVGTGIDPAAALAAADGSAPSPTPAGAALRAGWVASDAGTADPDALPIVDPDPHTARVGEQG